MLGENLFLHCKTNSPALPDCHALFSGCLRAHGMRCFDYIFRSGSEQSAGEPVCLTGFRLKFYNGQSQTLS
jgi:hypothetical protein